MKVQEERHVPAIWVIDDPRKGTDADAEIAAEIARRKAAGIMVEGDDVLIIRRVIVYPPAYAELGRE